MSQIVPIFEVNGDQFIVAAGDFIAESHELARRIGIGASIIECVLWGARYTYKTIDIIDGVMGTEADLWNTRIVIISGPSCRIKKND